MKIKSLVKRQSCKVLSLFAILSNVLLLLRPLEVPLFLSFISVYAMGLLCSTCRNYGFLFCVVKASANCLPETLQGISS